MIPLTGHQKNTVLQSMAQLISTEKEAILAANKKDVEAYTGDDISMYDRLIVNDIKVDGMILSLEQLIADSDPINKELYKFTHDNGMNIVNKTAPFGTVMIIYESRPDVTVEAAGIAFKSGNKILLKGGKESLNSNLVIVDLWHKALKENNISTDWVEYLNYNRTETQAFLENPTQKLDLIVPRGGEKLIAFVKKNAQCPVIVSGRGNNFVFVDKEADLELALSIINNGKTAKISACNAVDKVLIHSELPNKATFINSLISKLKESNVAILGDEKISNHEEVNPIESDAIWNEEFLDYKIVIGEITSTEEAITKINNYSGGHSAVIVTKNDSESDRFMAAVDSAAVYQNASTRFTDGGQFGLGGELAISTDKLHHRGPMGLHHLVTNNGMLKEMGKSDKKRIVLKIGSNVLTRGTDHISRGKIEDIARQIAALKEAYEFIIVSSGAIAAAKQFVQLEGKEVTVKQALASIGQPHLMRIYQENFRELGLLTSQCLLSYSDFEKEQSKTNIVNTINVLVENNYIPIINENDTVATDEIKFGDNDKLAALTAELVEADILLIATNTNGIYTKESIKKNKAETITSITNVAQLGQEVLNSVSKHGTGGMATKIEAATIAQKAGIDTWIVNGMNDQFIENAVNRKIDFTKITTV